MSKTALITGFTGQDGSYLAELLLEKGYRVVGHVRDPRKLGQSEHLVDRVTTVNFDSQSQREWQHAVATLTPDEIYHLAGVSFVPDSWHDPIGTVNANLNATLHALEAIRNAHPICRLFYACSSEIFGKPTSYPQNELTPIHPQTPYGVTKAASHWMIESYRQKYGVFACSGILFNHESPRRNELFVMRKITRAAAAISLGLQRSLILGDLDVERDWGFAGDFVDCMFRILQSDSPRDYTIGTGRLCSLRRVVETAFNVLKLDWERWVKCDSSLIRSNDKKTVVADCSNAQRYLGWKAKTSLEDLVQMMVLNDLRLLEVRQDSSSAA